MIPDKLINKNKFKKRPILSFRFIKSNIWKQIFAKNWMNFVLRLKIFTTKSCQTHVEIVSNNPFSNSRRFFSIFRGFQWISLLELPPWVAYFVHTQETAETEMASNWSERILVMVTVHLHWVFYIDLWPSLTYSVIVRTGK